MSTLVVFASTHGFTGACARRLADRLAGQTCLVNLETEPDPLPARFELVVLGGSIYAGRVQPGVQRFCHRNRDALQASPLALFLCCMKGDEEAAEQFDNAFPLRLRAHAFAHALLGGAFHFEPMNALQRWMMHRATGATATIERPDRSALLTFASQINARLLCPVGHCPSRN